MIKKRNLHTFQFIKKIHIFFHLLFIDKYIVLSTKMVFVNQKVLSSTDWESNLTISVYNNSTQLSEPRVA